MISLRGSVVPKVRLNCLFSKNVLFHNHVLKFHFSNLLVCSEKHSFLSKGINLHKYSTKPSGLFETSKEDFTETESVSNNTEKLNREKLYEEFAETNPDQLKKLKLIEFEIAVLKEQGCRVPENLTEHHFRELLNMDSALNRKQYLSFLRLNELLHLNKIEKDQYRKEKALRRKAEAGFHYYGLGGHTMFFRIYDKSINRLLNHRQLSAKLKIVFDCSYQEYMTPRNVRNCAKQILTSLNDARIHQYPSQVNFCNFNNKDLFGKVFPKYVTGVNENFYCDISEKSYLDLYPKNKLLYLTPHCQNDLLEFRRDDIFVIGAYVDRGSGVRASLAKAKENDMRMAKFPLDHFLFWKMGSKSLPLNIVVKILLDMSFYNDWKKAFKNIPTRFIYNFRSRDINNNDDDDDDNDDDDDDDD